MNRKLRVWKIWFYGKLPLAKRIQKRILFQTLLQQAREREPFYEYFTPDLFEKAVNAAQNLYWLNLHPANNPVKQTP